MKAIELNRSLKYKPWRPKLGQMPHLTIETNMTCNMTCRSCYNINHNVVKPFEKIKEEIDLGLTKRNAITISIVGGEPTLHPEITKVIRYIKSKNVFCQLLTNGLVLFEDYADQFIDELIESGLDRFIIHIDDGQEVYKNAIDSIHQLLKILENKLVLVSVSWTVYKESKGYLPEVIKEFSGYKNFDGLLSTLAKDLDTTTSQKDSQNDTPDLLDEYVSFRENLKLEPSIYLPSNLSNEHVKWLMYVYYINNSTFETFFISPFIARMYQNNYVKKILKIFFRKRRLIIVFSVSFLYIGLIEILLKPKRIIQFYKLLKGSQFMRKIRFHFLHIQDGPQYDSELKDVSICYHCPDATIRNGKITPVCLADRINPLPGSKANEQVNETLRILVYSHLGEL